MPHRHPACRTQMLTTLTHTDLPHCLKCQIFALIRCVCHHAHCFRLPTPTWRRRPKLSANNTRCARKFGRQARSHTSPTPQTLRSTCGAAESAAFVVQMYATRYRRRAQTQSPTANCMYTPVDLAARSRIRSRATPNAAGPAPFTIGGQAPPEALRYGEYCLLPQKSWPETLWVVRWPLN